jgi:integrase
VVWSYNVGSKVYYRARFWYFKNGEKRSKQKSGFLKKRDAERWEIDEKRRLEGLQGGADKIKVGEFLDRWIKTKEGRLSPSTIAGYKVNINHIKRFIGKEELYKLKLIDIQEMLDSLSAEGKRHRTVKYIHRTLHAALNYAVITELIPKNVSAGATVREDAEKFKVSVYDVKSLSKLLVMLKEQKHYIYPLVLLASMRGLRRGECLGLRWKDIDFKKGIAHIVNNHIRINGKSYDRAVKTRGSERTISIKGFLTEELKEIKSWSSGRIAKYVCERNGKLPDPTHISRALKAFQEANGLPVCRFHDLRHTFAMLQIEQGTDLDTLKRLLGHSKISITSDLYLHENINLIEKASTSLDNLVFVKPERKAEEK